MIMSLSVQEDKHDLIYLSINYLSLIWDEKKYLRDSKPKFSHSITLKPILRVMKESSYRTFNIEKRDSSWKVYKKNLKFDNLK